MLSNAMIARSSGSSHPGLGQDAHQAERVAVRRDHQGGRTMRGREQVASRALTAGLRVVGCREHDGGVDRQVVRLERGQVRVVTLTDVRAGQVPDEPDARVPAVHDEVLDRGERPAVVVRHGCRRVELDHERVRQDDPVARVTKRSQVRPARRAHDRHDTVHVGPRDARSRSQAIRSRGGARSPTRSRRRPGGPPRPRSRVRGRRAARRSGSHPGSGSGPARSSPGSLPALPVHAGTTRPRRASISLSTRSVPDMTTGREGAPREAQVTTSSAYIPAA